MDEELPPPFRLARLASKHSDFDKYKMGAVIVKKKRPISIGFNQLKSHPTYADCIHVFSIHAEVSAIIKSIDDVYRSDIYIYRENKYGNPVMAKPCIHCRRVLEELGVKNIYYTTEEFPYYRKEKLT